MHYLQSVEILAVLLHTVLCQENTTSATEQPSTVDDSCDIDEHPYLVSMVCVHPQDQNVTRGSGVLLANNWVLGGLDYHHRLDMNEMDYSFCKLLMDTDDERFPYNSKGSELRLYEVRPLFSKKLADVIRAYYFAYENRDKPVKMDSKKFVKLPQEKKFRDTCATVTVLGIGLLEATGSELKDAPVKKLQCADATFVECEAGKPKNCLQFVEESKKFCPPHRGLPVVCDNTIVGFVQDPNGDDCQPSGLFADIADYMSILGDAVGMRVPFQSIPPDKPEYFRPNHTDQTTPFDAYDETEALDERETSQATEHVAHWALPVGALLLLAQSIFG